MGLHSLLQGPLYPFTFTLEKWGFGLSRAYMLSLVEKYIAYNQTKAPFNNNLLSEDWFLNSKTMNKLSTKKPSTWNTARKT
jgi:hypothetical protein